MAKKREKSDKDEKGGKDDPAMAKVRTLFAESGLSLVELGRRMGYPEMTARQSAWQFMQSNDPRVSMLRKFADAMHISLDDLTPRRRRMSRKLETELEDAKCGMDARMFRELVVERHAVMHPSWTEDDLVCHPDDAKAFCGTIRSEVSADIPDHVILKALINARKAH
jgi:transcriptional regulator with XRE-family HTH domain